VECGTKLYRKHPDIYIYIYVKNRVYRFTVTTTSMVTAPSSEAVSEKIKAQKICT